MATKNLGAVRIALLRAVNVTAHNRVSMSDLRTFTEALGYGDVQTLVQSGNLVFRAPTGSNAAIERRLESEAAARLGIDTTFFLRSHHEWSAAIDANPYPKEAARDPARLVMVVLRDPPTPADLQSLRDAIKGRETVQVIGHHAYVVYPDGQGRSKLTIAVIEKHLRTRGTARNWNTVLKLGELSRTVTSQKPEAKSQK